MGLGLLYVLVAAGICSDNRVLVLTRRELAAFFYSPMAYIVMVCLTLVAWLLFHIFLDLIIRQSQPGETPLVEPIIRFYIIDWFPIICVTLVVPALTMRLLSEERRSGTLEVLLTAPLGEGAIVVSKFVAALLLYMVVWLPWGLYLAALRIQGGQSFDYYPLLSFFFALVATGAGFLSMGLFFSSLTRNQIIAFFLTVVGMLALLMVFFLKRFLTPDSTGYTILSYISYVDVWIDSLEGKLSPRFLMFHVSAAIFWLFVTVKVMEARRWA
jgi:ABC-type transport system involved in multi-copper enzyme maturation permease subunit